MLHVTDIHYDPFYLEGSADNCVGRLAGLPCCHIFDIVLKPYTRANKWGNYNCDTPFSLINRTLHWASEQLDPDVVLYTGDTADHNIWMQGMFSTIRVEQEVANVFSNAFPHTPVFVTHGNHDTFPIDQTMPFVYSHMLEQMGTIWGNWLSPKASEQFKKNGSYVQTILPNLDLVSLNTVPFNAHNIFHSKHSQLQWDWLNRTLARSKKNEHYVWLISHISPQSRMSFVAFNSAMANTIGPYRDIIKGSFFGHSHKDEFKLVDGKWVAMVSPSLLPAEHGSCVRLFEYDDFTYELLDYTNYCADVSEQDIHFRPLYSFRETYGVDDASIQSWSLLYQKLTYNETAQNLYCYFHFGHHVSSDACRTAVRNTLLLSS